MHSSLFKLFFVPCEVVSFPYLFNDNATSTYYHRGFPQPLVFNQCPDDFGFGFPESDCVSPGISNGLL